MVVLFMVLKDDTINQTMLVPMDLSNLIPEGHLCYFIKNVGRYVVEAETEKIAVIALGYADGFRRMAGNRVLIRGVSCPVVGTVCMDQCMVHVPDELPVQEGDEVVVIGRQGEAQILVSEVAERWETIAYEVTCGLSPRVRRVYSED